MLKGFFSVFRIPYPPSMGKSLGFLQEIQLLRHLKH